MFIPTRIHILLHITDIIHKSHQAKMERRRQAVYYPSESSPKVSIHTSIYNFGEKYK